MIQEKLHQNYCRTSQKLKEWYAKTTKDLSVPIYSSYDIRDSGYKVSNVDANIFPAGFNNICHQDMDAAVEIMQEYLDAHYGPATKKILLITEEHTQNPYYWDNVAAIDGLIKGGGREVLIAMPKRMEAMTLKSASGKEVRVVSGFEDSAEVKAFRPDLIVSNNDFSQDHAEWSEKIVTPMNPPRELGWYQRKKSNYFRFYNQLVKEFADIVEMDPFHLNVATELFPAFDPDDKAALDKLGSAVDRMVANLKTEYSKRGIDAPPVVFVKDNAGTYGMGVTRVESGADIVAWNAKSRKKMRAAKGGREVSEVIVQEGIPSRVQSDGATAEPCIYMIGCELAGGFLRTHSEKSATESLNSPGAVYRRLCVSDLNVSLQGNPLENVYGWSARLGLLAIGLEARELGAEFQGYKNVPCGAE